MVTRSEPPVPAPVRTEMVGVAVTADQRLGELLLPDLNTKSLALIDAWLPPVGPMSTMMPLIPRVKLVMLLKTAVVALGI